MPKCEGLPDGPCPHNVNNRSVKLAQGDLMLCPKCEAVRFPPVKLSNCLEAANTNDDKSSKNASSSSGTVTNARSKPKQLQPAGASLAVTGAEASVNCINAGVITCTTSAATTDEQSVLFALPAPVSAVVNGVETSGGLNEDPFILRRLVQHQQLEISRLQTQLNFVLSFLGIDEADISISDTNEDGHPDGPVSLSTLSNLSQDAPAASTEGPKDPTSWSEVVRRKKTNKKPSNLQQSVVAAVYVDQSLKKRRETSLIVSGLESAPGKPDSELFSCLCSDELHIQPDVIKTERLGIGNSSSGKPRPLLVILRGIDQAQQLISSARLLRRSTNPAIRDKVYINPNLTKAEAEAAYLLRVKRRMTAQQRSDRDARQRSHRSPAPDHSHDILMDAATTLPKSAAVDVSSLNPQANQFIPVNVSLHSASD